MLEEEKQDLERATEQFRKMGYARDAQITELERERKMMQEKSK